VSTHSITEELRFLAGGGEMGRRIREYDWSTHPLGPPVQWPATLQSILALCLNSSIPTCVYWGSELRLLYNDAWAPIPGHRHPSALGSSAAEVWPDIWKIIRPQFEQVLTTGVGFATYDQMLPIDRNGRIEETFWNYSLSPIRDEAGNIVGIFNQGNETTQKVQSARASKNELDRMRELFEQAPGAIALLEGPRHVYALANAAYVQLVGPRAILGKPVAEVLPEVIEQGFGEVLDRVYNTGERFLASSTPVRLRRTPSGDFENRILDFVFQPIRRDADTITGIFVQATDVTERAQAEAALRASEENLRRLNERLEALVQERTSELSSTLHELQSVVHRLRTTLQTSFIYQGYLRPDGVLLEANAASLAGIECRPEDVVGSLFWDTPWFNRTPGMAEMVREAVRSVARGESMRRRIDVQLPIGVRTFDFSMRPVKDERGIVIGIVPEAADITPVLQTEERLRQSQKMEAVGQLTGGIAHDFNNLLTGIVGSLDMIERRIAQGRYERVSEYAKAAIASANRAAALTHRLLAFARRQPLDSKPVAVNALIATVADMLRRTLGEKIHLEILAGGDLWLTRCDANQLENALLNLVINARDAMPNGGQITIETSNCELAADSSRPLRAGQYICISVTDNGVGMSAEVIAKAFDPFFTTKPLGQGTGLGLSMIYGFVLQSEGDITISSEVGAGSTITLYLPRYFGELPESDSQVSETGSYRALTQETVLVVEDDAVVRRLISDVLAELGYRVIEAPDGKAGLQLLMSDEHFKLLITDVGLPQLDGREMVERARAHRPRLQVLFITGYAEHVGMGSDWLVPGMKLLAKPFTMASLAQQVTEMIGNA
jgi:signal transduction histidine kinase